MPARRPSERLSAERGHTGESKSATTQCETALMSSSVPPGCKYPAAGKAPLPGSRSGTVIATCDEHSRVPAHLLAESGSPSNSSSTAAQPLVEPHAEPEITSRLSKVCRDIQLNQLNVDAISQSAVHGPSGCLFCVSSSYYITHRTTACPVPGRSAGPGRRCGLQNCHGTVGQRP